MIGTDRLGPGRMANVDARTAKPRLGRDPADLVIAAADLGLGRLVDLLEGDDPAATLKALRWPNESGAASAVALPIRRSGEAGGGALFRVPIVHDLCAFGADPGGRMAAPGALLWADRLGIEPVVLASIRSGQGTLAVAVEEVVDLTAEDPRPGAASTSYLDRSRGG
jgi:hypothetical protein